MTGVEIEAEAIRLHALAGAAIELNELATEDRANRAAPSLPTRRARNGLAALLEVIEERTEALISHAADHN